MSDIFERMCPLCNTGTNGIEVGILRGSFPYGCDTAAVKQCHNCKESYWLPLFLKAFLTEKQISEIKPLPEN